MHHKMLSIPGLYPLDARSSLPTIATTKICPDIAKRLMGDKNDPWLRKTGLTKTFPLLGSLSGISWVESNPLSPGHQQYRA